MFLQNFGSLTIPAEKSVTVTREDLTDETLMMAFKEGDERAFQILFLRHRKALYGYLLRFLGQAQAAEEAFQEVFLRLIRSAQQYKSSSRFTSWLYSITRNYCIDQSRKRRFRNHVSLDEKAGEQVVPLKELVASNEAGADDRLTEKNLQSALHRILQGLNLEQREVFLMREFQGLTFEDIARLTKTSANTVKSRMRYALQSIQKELVQCGFCD